jgi:hypothetical protein
VESLPVSLLPHHGAALRRHVARSRVAFAICAVALVTLSAGCVQRRLLIRTNPPGALVYIDDYEIGTTPVSTDYLYYGTRKIRIVKDGFETLTVEQPVKAPWYEIFPLEFVSENVIPWEIRDERALDYTLVPQVIVPQEQLNLRQVTRASATAPANVGPAPGSPLPLPAPVPQVIPPGPRSVLPEQLPPSPGFLPPPATAPLLGPALPPPSGTPSRQPSSGSPY